MRNTLNNLILSTLALAALTLTAVAEPASSPSPSGSSRGDSNAPINTVIETLEARPAPEQPLIVQEDIDKDRAAEQTNRPRGESRTARDKASRSLEKPLLEVHGF